MIPVNIALFSQGKLGNHSGCHLYALAGCLKLVSPWRTGDKAQIWPDSFNALETQVDAVIQLRQRPEIQHALAQTQQFGG
jgi:hypothetical protein